MFGFFFQIPDETTYIWKGVDQDCIKGVYMDVLNNTSDGSENNYVWDVCAKFLRVMLLERKVRLLLLLLLLLASPNH